MLKINEIIIAPENYEIEVLDRIPQKVLKHSQMARVEKQFVNGLVRMFRPRRILEIGVHSGGGSSILLNAISDMPEATVTSVDVTEFANGLIDKEVGFAALMLYPEGNKQWSMHTGKDFSEICESFSEKFDFCVIDTAHYHPVESLNFLTALPYLEDGAIVVFHDISAYKFYPIDDLSKIVFANILCFGTIVGNKIKPVDEAYLRDDDPVVFSPVQSNQFNFSNIGAVQITEDTRKYIANVFDMLLFPWAGYSQLVAPYIRSVAKIIKKNYPEDLFKIFCESATINALMVHNDYKYATATNLDRLIHDTVLSSKKIVFYGGGSYCKWMLGTFKRNNLPAPIEIWDKKAENIVSLEGIPVIEPQFGAEREKYSDTIFVITLEDKQIIEEVAMKILCTILPKKIFSYYETEKSIIYVEATGLEKVEID